MKDRRALFHPRNRHPGRYDFSKLIASCPELARFVAPNAYQDLSIDFSDPDAVRTLNRALLSQFYGITHWDVPKEYLCPPIPGRSDYVHLIADLLARGGEIPRGRAVRGLDIGVGANCIYPIIGHCEYGWSFVGSDVDPVALGVAGEIVRANPALASSVELRLQPRREKILEGVLRESEIFDFTICNPPFHSSLEEAHAGSSRKWRNLGREAKDSKKPPVRNFGGQSGELWCPGGEVGFVGRLIRESAGLRNRVTWFSALISKEVHLPEIHGALAEVRVSDQRTIEMSQGQKKSRIVAWTFGT